MRKKPSKTQAEDVHKERSIKRRKQKRAAENEKTYSAARKAKRKYSGRNRRHRAQVCNMEEAHITEVLKRKAGTHTARKKQMHRGRVRLCGKTYKVVKGSGSCEVSKPHAIWFGRISIIGKQHRDRDQEKMKKMTYIARNN
jgi:hypothetical protein